jgi:aminoglycoside phosphotransferase (APT) family kinase protein
MDPNAQKALRTGLEAWFQTKLPAATALLVSDFEPAPSGLSNETHFFELSWSEHGQRQSQRLVARWAPDAQAMFPNYDLGLQFHVMRCLRVSPVPVPKVWWLEQDAAVLGKPFYVMERVDGEIASGFRPGFHGHGLFFDASIERRRRMWWNAVDTMIKVHALDWRALGIGEVLGDPKSGVEALDRGIAQMEGWLDWAAMDPLPELRAAIAWLKQNRYEPARVSLCWGDVRPGNMVYRGDEVIAGLDWEHALIAPPEFDLAYFILADLITAEINQVPRLPGIPEGAETIAYYERAIGRKLENYLYAEVFQAARMAVFLVLTVKSSPRHIRMPADFATNNIPTRRLARLLGL